MAAASSGNRGFPVGVRLVGYFPSWSRSSPSTIPGELLTHLIFAFALPGQDGSCAIPQNAQQHLPALIDLKRLFPHLRILVSIGGSGNAKAFNKIVENPASIQAFARNCVAMMTRHGFDGLDLDWEFPSENQKTALTTLVSAIRAELAKKGEQDQQYYLFTLAAPAGPWSMKNYEFDRLVPLLDWLNLMTYNYYGSWSPITGFNAPLYTMADDPQQLSVDSTVRAYLQAGVPPSKLLMGIPFYGRIWGNVASKNNGLFQTYDPQFKDISPTLDYADIKAKYQYGAQYRFHDTARVPWLYLPEKNIFISYEDPKSVNEKAVYARMKNLGGVMIWQISGDDNQRSLLSSVAEGVGYSKLR